MRVATPSAAVTVALTVVVPPGASATWWPGTPASASAGAISTDAPASFGVAVTVVSATA